MLDHKSILKAIILVLFFFFCSTRVASAKIELTNSSPPSEIQLDKTVSIDVTLSGVDPQAEYYIRGVFYKPETTQYFGYTQNNQNNWHKDSNTFTEFYKVIGNTSTSITFKPDLDSSHFTPNTGYLFKIGRYTPGGSLTWSEQSPSTVYISNPVSPTPTTTLDSSPTPTVFSLITVTPTPSATPTTTIVDISSVTLSEIMACPNSNEEEWVEIKNQTASAFSIENWKLKDSTDTHSLTVQGRLNSYGYLIIHLNSSLLNNSGDSVRLFAENGQLVDQMSYTNCSTGNTFMKVDDKWLITTTPSQGSTNIYQAILTTTPVPTSKLSSPTPTPPPNNEENENTHSVDTLEDFEDTIVSATEDLSAPVTTEEIQPTSNSEKTTSSPLNTLPQNDFLSQSSAFLLGGCSYIITAALLAQKWYTITST